MSPPLRRALTMGALVLAAALALSACQPPVTPDNKPTPAPGQQNGRLPASLLQTVRPGCEVNIQAVPALIAMIEAASRDGVEVIPMYCYRSYDEQVAVRQQKCAEGNCNLAAVPGTSIHGWGKAIDFGDGTPTFTFASPAYRWMTDFAWQYGWNHPGWAEASTSTPEPWHWEWVGDGGTLYPGTIIGPQGPRVLWPTS